MWMRRRTDKGWGKWHPFDRRDGRAWSLCGRIQYEGWDRDWWQWTDKPPPERERCQNHNCGGRVPRTGANR